MTEIQRFRPENPRITQLKAEIETNRANLLALPFVKYVQGVHITDTTRYSQIPFGVTVLPITHEWARADYTPFDTQSIEAVLEEFAVTQSPKLQRAYRKLLRTVDLLDQQFSEAKIDNHYVDERSDVAWKLFNTKRSTYIKEHKILLLEALNQAMYDTMTSLQNPPYIIK